MKKQKKDNVMEQLIKTVEMRMITEFSISLYDLLNKLEKKKKKIKESLLKSNK